MREAAFDRLARRLAATLVSRRAALGRLSGGALTALGLASGKRAKRAAAQEATPRPNQDLADVQAGLDALDAGTRDSLARALWTTELRAEDFTAEQLRAVLSERNSNAAFGQRMGLHLIELVVAPPSFVPDAAARYAAFYPYCSSLSTHQAYAMRGLLGPQQSQGYLEMPGQADLSASSRTGLARR